MSTCEDIVLMAAYNASMNGKVYAAAARLSPQQFTEDRQAFFGSIAGTLNHLIAADTIWLKRFAEHPARFPALAAAQALPKPSGLDQMLSSELPVLLEHRLHLDAIISAWAAQVTPADLDHALAYVNSQGPQRKNYGAVLRHFFNHQTHHRGQASTLLSQAGVDIGVTDLLALIPNEE
jgi:uncharacterized damage-inducible protein DinB